MTKRTRIGPKEVMTFTSLLAKAQQLKVSDAMEYRSLAGWSGSGKLLDGCTVRMLVNNSTKLPVRFDLRGKDGNDYCHVGAVVIEGKCYTHYQPAFSSSKYDKKVQRYLPFDLPEGSKTYLHNRCRFLNADGSVALDNGRGWDVNGRGSVGRTPHVIAIRDNDGKFCSDQMPGLQDLRYYGSHPIQACLGTLEDTCQLREWFDSMVGPHWDSNRVRLLAIRTYKEALRMVAAHPHMKIALYPMAKRPVNAMYIPHRLCIANPGAHVLERDSQLEPLMYYLPSLCLYWVEGQEHYKQVHCIYANIPPHGCRLLELDREVPEAVKQVRQGRVSLGDEALKHRLSKGDVLERVAYTFGKNTKLDGVKINWGAHPDLVRTWQYDPDAKVKGIGRAVKPEDAFNSIEEKALMSVLPLC
jgi:hypothetical protein